MKLACSSASFDSAIAAGKWTQLEWLDRCAAEFDVDGVVFEAKHFARTDGEYVAQLKKMAADLRLTVAALACDAVLVADGDGSADAQPNWFDVASTLGAPVLVARPPAANDSGAWAELVAGCKAAAARAKRSNVTLALRNAPGTPCAAAADLLQAAKEVDSSWLRFAPDLSALDPPGDFERVLPRTVIAACELSGAQAQREERLDATLEGLGPFRGFLIVEAAEPAALPSALQRVRTALARAELANG